MQIDKEIFTVLLNIEFSLLNEFSNIAYPYRSNDYFPEMLMMNVTNIKVKNDVKNDVKNGHSQF